MEVKEVKFRKYIPAEGMALKITELSYNHETSKVEPYTMYTPKGCIIDEDVLCAPVEEVPMSEYEDYCKNTSGLALGASF